MMMKLSHCGMLNGAETSDDNSDCLLLRSLVCWFGEDFVPASLPIDLIAEFELELRCDPSCITVALIQRNYSALALHSCQD